MFSSYGSKKTQFLNLKINKQKNWDNIILDIFPDKKKRKRKK